MLGSSGVRAGVGGAVGTWLYVLLLVVDAIRLQHDARLQDALIDGTTPTAPVLGLPMARAREPLPAGRHTRFWAQQTVSLVLRVRES